MNLALNGTISPHDESVACIEKASKRLIWIVRACVQGYLWFGVWRSPTHWSVWLQLRVNSDLRISQRGIQRNGGELVPVDAVEKILRGEGSREGTYFTRLVFISNEQYLLVQLFISLHVSSQRVEVKWGKVSANICLLYEVYFSRICTLLELTTFYFFSLHWYTNIFTFFSLCLVETPLSLKDMNSVKSNPRHYSYWCLKWSICQAMTSWISSSKKWK